MGYANTIPYEVFSRHIVGSWLIVGQLKRDALLCCVCRLLMLVELWCSKKKCFCLCLEKDKITKRALPDVLLQPSRTRTTGQRAVLYAWVVGVKGTGLSVIFPKRLVSVFTTHLSNSEADVLCLLVCLSFGLQNAANPIVFMYVFIWKHFVTSRWQARSAAWTEIQGDTY